MAQTTIEGMIGPDHGRFFLRCPDCDHLQSVRSRAAGVSLQRKRPCPNCNRMMALSERGGDG